MDHSDILDLTNDLIDAIAEVFPDAYQKAKEAQLRLLITKILKEYLE